MCHLLPCPTELGDDARARSIRIPTKKHLGNLPYGLLEKQAQEILHANPAMTLKNALGSSNASQERMS